MLVKRPSGAPFHRRAVTAVALTLVAVLAGALAGEGRAHFSAGSYTHNACPHNPPSTRVDPVNIVFYRNATGAAADSAVVSYAGWTNTTGSTQWFISHAACGGMSHQRASGTFSRFHIRMRKTYHNDATLGTTTQASAHHED